MDSPLIQYGIIALYFTFILTKGIRKSKEIKDQEDFLVAGRNIGWLLLLATMSATVLGGGASIGSIGKTYEWGIVMLLVTTGWYFQFMFSGKYIAPYFREAKLYTVAGFFGHRFDKRSRFVSFVLSLLFSVGVLGAQLVAFGKIINSMLPEFTYLWAVIAGALIVIIYSTAGGLLAVIYTDVYQFFVLVFGFLFTVIMCIPELMEHQAEIANTIPPEFFEIDGGKGLLFLASTFLAFLMGETFAPGYATRFCVGKDIKETKKGIFRAGVLLLFTFPVILFFISLYSKFFFPDIDPEQALPRTILRLHNPFVSGLIIAALMSAVMSSADSILNSSTAIFMKDFYEEYLAERKISASRGLLYARISTVIIGLLGVLLAILLPDVIDLLLLTYSVWAPGILLPVIIGVFVKKKNDRHNLIIFLSMVASVVLTLIYVQTDYADSVQPVVAGVGFSIFIYFFLNLLFKRRDK